MNTSNRHPLVSIVIPTYNRQTWLSFALSSLQAQTLAEWEAIVVDDGSTDGTKDMVLRLGEGDPRIRYAGSESVRKGAPARRNEGFTLSRADAIVFLDSDDALAPWALERRLEALGADPALDFVVFPTLLFKETPGDTDRLWNRPSSPTERDLDRFLRQDMPWGTLSVMWRRSAVANLGGWDETMSCFQDFDYHIRALLRGFRYAASAQPDSYYRNADDISKISSPSVDPISVNSKFTALANAIREAQRQALWTRRLRLLAIGFAVRNTIQLIESGRQEDARDWFRRSALELGILRPVDRMILRLIIRDGRKWRYRRIINWLRICFWSRSMRYDPWQTVSFLNTTLPCVAHSEVSSQRTFS